MRMMMTIENVVTVGGIVSMSITTASITNNQKVAIISNHHLVIISSNQRLITTNSHPFVIINNRLLFISSSLFILNLCSIRLMNCAYIGNAHSSFTTPLKDDLFKQGIGC